MINAKLGMLIAAAIAVIVAAYFTMRAPSTQETTPTPISASPAPSAVPSPQYLHDHPEELKEAKAKCSGGTAPSQLYCYNVEKAEELVEADEYSNAAAGRTKPK